MPARKKAKPRIRMDVDERRAQLVALGLEKFGSHTYEELSIDVIAQMAGISKGLLYHYFPTKSAYYVACVREATRRLVELYDAPIDRSLPPLDQLANDVDRYLGYVRNHGRAYSVMMKNGAGIDREVGVAIDETREVITSRLREGISHTIPDSRMLAGPLLDLSLRGWVGLAEAMSIDWVEACVAAESTPNAEVPTQAQVRTLLVNALVAIVQSAVTT